MNYVLDNKQYEKCPTEKLKVTNILLNTADVPINASTNSFVLHLQETLQNIVAIRPIRMEYYNTSNTGQTITLNGINIPLQATQGALLNINNYRNIITTNSGNSFGYNTRTVVVNGSSNIVPTTPVSLFNNDINIFHRLINGVDVLPIPKENIFEDPYTYIFKPIQRRLDRIEVTIYSNSYVPITTGTVIAVLAVYTVDGKCNY